MFMVVISLLYLPTGDLESILLGEGLHTAAFKEFPGDSDVRQHHLPLGERQQRKQDPSGRKSWVK